MRSSRKLLPLLILTSLAIPFSVTAQKQMAQSPRILSAKTVFFEDRSGSDAVAAKALAQLKKWGRFQIVQDRRQADVVFLLSADAYNGGHLIYSGGQTGTIEDGKVTEDKIPNYNHQDPVRYAYLTVIDPKTGENLWSDKHIWGGLLTGANSAGERLVKELESQTKK